jgi:hypothetical protein
MWEWAPMRSMRVRSLTSGIFVPGAAIVKVGRGGRAVAPPLLLLLWLWLLLLALWLLPLLLLLLLSAGVGG